MIADNISHTYMQGSEIAVTALKDISLSVEKGEFLGLIGHTGSGKSTLALIMAGLLQPAKGSITVDGLDLSDKKQRSAARSLIGMVFQYPEYQLFEETVFKDIAYGPKNLKLPEAEIASRVEEAMQLVGLSASYMQRSPFELSGGEKRRCALAGTIAMRPQYLIMDEPMAGLDPAGRTEIMDTILELKRQTGCAVIMISHSMDDMGRAADRLAVLADGALLRTDTPEEIFKDADELVRLGLDIPHISRLSLALRARGVDAPATFDIDVMEKFLVGRAKHV